MMRRALAAALALAGALMLFSCTKAEPGASSSAVSSSVTSETAVTLENLPPFSGTPYVVLTDNQPLFSSADRTTESYEFYSELDALGRCGVTVACVGQDIMPTEERGSIGQVKPTGWHTVKYDWVDGRYLYNRCHLIGFQLTGENANVCNLITGTRYLNVDGMLPFENLVADYVKETGNHVLYRVTPIFVGDELVARGVDMEGYSVEDEGEGVCFHVYCYNSQPGVVIDYATGESRADAAPPSSAASEVSVYVLNTGNGKFHLPSCASAKDIKPANRQTYSGERQALLDQGYSPCKSCNP